MFSTCVSECVRVRVCVCVRLYMCTFVYVYVRACMCACGIYCKQGKILRMASCLSYQQKSFLIPIM